MDSSFQPGPNGERYFLRGDFRGSAWTEVSKADWIKAERAAGFRPKMANDDSSYMDTCATGGFSSSGGVRGWITTDGDMPKHA